MDVQTIDNQYTQLQTQAQQTVGELQALAQKLQAAAQAGNQDAREWFLDLKSVALAVQAEQNQVSNLLGALHNFVTAQASQPQQLPQSVPQSVPQTQNWGSQPQYPQQQPYPQQGYYPQQQGGGLLGGLFNSSFGRAIVTGAGFGIGDDLINKIF
ncbi:hypothetical protein [Acidocella sp.]|uniref:hypothetical protein n=1 Tax=Acidocella sp. TaxID=50710 RepID=UPI002633EDCD|nr:hypothetical protein [Acidocella sp.]